MTPHRAQGPTQAIAMLGMYFAPILALIATFGLFGTAAMPGLKAWAHAPGSGLPPELVAIVDLMTAIMTHPAHVLLLVLTIVWAASWWAAGRRAYYLRPGSHEALVRVARFKLALAFYALALHAVVDIPTSYAHSTGTGTPAAMVQLELMLNIYGAIQSLLKFDLLLPLAMLYCLGRPESRAQFGLPTDPPTGSAPTAPAQG